MDQRDQLIRAARDARHDYDQALAGVSAASARLATAVAALEAYEVRLHAHGARARVAAALDLSWTQVGRHVARAGTAEQGVDTLSS